MLDSLLWLHPAMQAAALLIGLWALWLSYNRIKMKRGQKVIFAWKQHVRYGSIALFIWILGLLGFYITSSNFGSTFITGIHADLAILIILLSILGLATGMFMNKNKKKRKYLPLIHGIGNLILVLLVIYEAYLGYFLLDSFI